MAKNYVDKIKIEDFTLTKDKQEMYLEFESGLSEHEINEFLKRKKDKIEWEFEREDRKKVILKKYNKSAKHSKWVQLAKGAKEQVDSLIKEFEKTSLVRFASPVYSREDLKEPNGFTFTDEIIVRVDEKIPDKELKSLLKELSLEKVINLRGKIGKGLILLKVLNVKARNTHEVAEQLSAQKLIKSAKVNLIQLHSGILAIPNDTYFNNQWNLRNTGQTMPDGNVATAGADINVEKAWDISKGSPLIVIAILDTGCDLTHPDLLPKYVQPDRWLDASTGTATPNDDLGHGTNCAGIAASLTNSFSAQGVAGVGWHCRIMPVRMIWDGGYGMSEAAILAALDHALNNGADITSMSWRWDGATTDIDTALQDCFDAGITLVAAAGNTAVAEPDFICYPASNANVIAVGATNENDIRCTFSDWPSWANNGSHFGPELSVVAPGVHIWSTDIQGTGAGYNVGIGGDAAGNYWQNMGGTSGATPHVAGLAGLILAYNPTLTPTQVRAIIENTADDQVGDPGEDVAGWDKYMGHGRINAHAALQEVVTSHPFTPADVYLRNSLTDFGVEPYIGWPLCYSPDIIIRKAAVADPQTEFADMTVDPGSDNVEIGNDNYIYIRVHNKGAIDSDIHARIYFAPLTTSCSPDQWEYIGQIDFTNVRAGSSAISDQLVWKNVPDPGSIGHYCLIASIEGFRDPHPDPEGIGIASEYMQFIRDNNNISYRNVVFENLLPNTLFTLNFNIAGFLREKAKFDLLIERNDLAIRSKLDLKLPDRMFKSEKVLLENAMELVKEPLRGFRRFNLKELKRPAIRGLVIHPKSRDMAQLQVKVPADAKPGEVIHLNVQQVYEGEVIGDFQFVGKLVEPTKVKFIAQRGEYLVHKANCKHFHGKVKELMRPFESLLDAKSAGYDMALDCLNQPFTAKDVSYRLARKVLQFVNSVELPEDMEKVVKDTLGIGYFKGRYGNAGIKEGYGLRSGTAREILRARDETGPFTKLEQIESIKGVGKDTLIDLVNLFK